MRTFKVISRIFCVIFCIIVFSAAIAVFAFFAITKDATFDKSKLIKTTQRIVFYDVNGNVVPAAESKTVRKTAALETLPAYVKNAFIAVEDKRFYSHCGVDARSLLRAAKSNLFNGKAVEGGSTITQQLIKNTHLSPEKTIKRKLCEVKLALIMEQELSKDKILECYLNTVYFGNGAYGIENAANVYFSKSAADLDLNQAASLAATVKAPASYNPCSPRNLKRKDLVLSLMKEQKMISANDFEKHRSVAVKTDMHEKNDYFLNVENELFERFNVSPYPDERIEVYTFFDPEAQAALDTLSDCTDYDKCAYVISKRGEIKAVKYDSCDANRMPASAIKPLLVYAPAIDTKIISPATKINDEKTDFSGYSPKNYGDKYYGWISAEDCLAKSLNVPAVKLLESLTTKKANSYMQKLGIKIDESSLTSALGVFNDGCTLLNLSAAYTVFCSDGCYYEPHYIKSAAIGRLSITSPMQNPTRVFNEGTAELINDMLKKCAESGTGKALSDKKYPVCVKTGTNGTSSGNTDALAVLYTSEDIISLRASSTNGKPLPNEFTGARAAAYIGEVADEYYKKGCPPDFKPSGQVRTVRLCKLAYEDGKLMLAPENQPERFTFTSKFLCENVPKEVSDYYFSPKIKQATIEKTQNGAKITIEKNDFVSVKITRTNEKGELFECELKENEFNDCIIKDGVYEYVLTPYISSGDGVAIYGESVTLPAIMICEKEDFLNRDWWNE